MQQNESKQCGLQTKNQDIAENAMLYYDKFLQQELQYYLDFKDSISQLILIESTAQQQQNVQLNSKNNETQEKQKLYSSLQSECNQILKKLQPQKVSIQKECDSIRKEYMIECECLKVAPERLVKALQIFMFILVKKKDANWKEIQEFLPNLVTTLRAYSFENMSDDEFKQATDLLNNTEISQKNLAMTSMFGQKVGNVFNLMINYEQQRRAQLKPKQQILLDLSNTIEKLEQQNENLQKQDLLLNQKTLLKQVEQYIDTYNKLREILIEFKEEK